ncbi:MAG: right-handed parallel beta-helix repeat-containing protein [Deltaproteobacteria bacterium]|nr:right-handed parallel beta-helix repeat-containing protein [Deltaproteobacteria bacterium]
MKRLVRRTLFSGLPLLPILALLSACGWLSSTPPAPPTDLSATGALGVIRLSWTDAGPVVAHNIYRSTDNVTFVKRNGDKVGGTSYDDAISSPAGDGVFYFYRITAVDTEESEPSTTVRAIHGTRLATTYVAGFTSDNTASPYVLEGTTVVDRGGFLLQGGDKLYLLDNAVIDVEQGNDVTVQGLLRVLAASGASHATITSHRVSAPLAPGEGFSITFDGADDFNPTDNTGTWIRNTLLSNLGSSQAISISNCSPRIENCKAISSDNTGTSYLSINPGGGPSIRNCTFDNMTLQVSGGDPSATTLAIENNIFTNSYYAVSFWNLTGPGVSPGQISNNVFDGGKTAYLWNVTGANVPMDGNFWKDAYPDSAPTTVTGGSTTATYSFYPTLPAAPTSAGPDW